MTDASATFTEGAVVADRYVVERLLGVGGLAEVYLVRHAELGSLHALKLLTVRKRGLADRLLLEGRIQAQLRHPNIVAVTDVLRFHGEVALVLEYVHGEPLDAWLADRGALTVAQALELFAPILAAVSAAHAVGILHRDLKPSNVMLARTSGGLVPKVADFGLAKSVQEGEGSGTRTGMAMGTPGYMAPEQVRDSANVDARTDVFALGAILWELIAGRRAFEDEHGEVGLLSTVEVDAPALDAVAAEVPPGVVEAVRRALARERDERFADARAFAAALYPSDHPVLRQVDAMAPVSLALDRRAYPASGASSGGGGAAPTQVMGQAGGDTIAPPAPAHPTLLPPTRSGSQLDTLAETRAPARRALPVLALGLIAGGGLVLVGGIAVLMWVAGSQPAPAPGAAPGEARAVVEPVPVHQDADAVAEAAAVPASDPAAAAAPVLAVAPLRAVDPVPASTPASTPASVAPTSVTGAAPMAVPAPEGVADPEPTPRVTPAPPSATEPAAATRDEPMAPSQGTAEAAEEGPPAWMDRLTGTWTGDAGNRAPMELRILGWDGEVRAEMKFITGATTRSFPVRGTYDPTSGALKLSGGTLTIEGFVKDGALTGTYKQGNGKLLPFSTARR